MSTERPPSYCAWTSRVTRSILASAGTGPTDRSVGRQTRPWTTRERPLSREAPASSTGSRQAGVSSSTTQPGSCSQSPDRRAAGREAAWDTGARGADRATRRSTSCRAGGARGLERSGPRPRSPRAPGARGAHRSVPGQPGRESRTRCGRSTARRRRVAAGRLFGRTRRRRTTRRRRPGSAHRARTRSPSASPASDRTTRSPVRRARSAIGDDGAGQLGWPPASPGERPPAGRVGGPRLAGASDTGQRHPSTADASPAARTTQARVPPLTKKARTAAASWLVTGRGVSSQPSARVAEDPSELLDALDRDGSVHGSARRVPDETGDVHPRQHARRGRGTSSKDTPASGRDVGDRHEPNSASSRS